MTTLVLCISEIWWEEEEEQLKDTKERSVPYTIPYYTIPYHINTYICLNMSKGGGGQPKQPTPDFSGTWNHVKSENISEFLAANGKVFELLQI